MSKIFSSGSIQSLGYSTSETYTGERWIDGSKIYRKVFNIGTVTSDSYDVAHNISNLSLIIGIYGITALEKIYINSLPYYKGNLYIIPMVVGSNIHIDKNNGNNYYSTYVILEYTKTTG